MGVPQEMLGAMEDGLDTSSHLPAFLNGALDWTAFISVAEDVNGEENMDYQSGRHLLTRHLQHLKADLTDVLHHDYSDFLRIVNDLSTVDALVRSGIPPLDAVRDDLRGVSYMKR